LRAEAEATSAKAKLSSIEALNAHLQLLIAKLERDKHGPSRERTQRLIDQMELQLEELVADATEDELASQAAAARTQTVRAFTRKRPVRKPWPENIERERVVIEAPTACDHCGSERLSKLGEDTTETLEEVPRRFKVVETVREKFTCRDCDCISQAPAPFHATPRGFLGPKLLATIVFDKFSEHQPLNRQSRRFRSEGIDLSTQTLADQVGYVSAAVKPLFDLIETHVFAAERLHGDDTTIPILPRASARRGVYGPTFATTGHLVGYHRRRPSSTPPVIGGVNIRNDIWPSSPGSCRPIATMASIRSLIGPRNKSR
jgi:transposase